MEAFAVQALERVFPDAAPRSRCRQVTCLAGERGFFQVACRETEVQRRDVTVQVESPLGDRVTVRKVGCVPAVFLRYEHADPAADWERTEPGIFPDVLEPFTGTLRLRHRFWESLFVTVETADLPGGTYPVTLCLSRDGQEDRVTVFIRVLPLALPEQELLMTQWFHADCVAEAYGVKVFSPAHWAWMERFLRVAARNGVNLILTPLFTPPLDTAVGGERTTVQLVDVEKTPEGYRFGFSRLRRWVRMCHRVGIRKFEMSHLFTQWGAKHAPKIMGRVNGETVRLFGWETDAAGAEYRAFLATFLPELLRCLREWGIDGDCFFHISDEPTEEMLTDYLAAKAGAAPYLAGYPIMDALSHYDLYEKGAVQIPVIHSGTVHTFLEKGYTHPWVYYCCGQDANISNRHFAMPLSRTREMGMELYKYQCRGFLQWGYNFYHSSQSLRVIDPYAVTDADRDFPAGDAFSVYPGKEDCLESIRLVAFTAGLADLAALRLLEKKLPHAEVVDLLEQDGPITFLDAPHGMDWLLAARERVNAALCRAYGVK